MGGLCIPTNECSKSGEQFPKPSITHTHPTHIQTSKHCLPLYSFVHQTKGICYTSLIGVNWDIFEDRLPYIGPQSLSNILQHNSLITEHLFNSITVLYFVLPLIQKEQQVACYNPCGLKTTLLAKCGTHYILIILSVPCRQRYLLTDK